MSVMGSAERRPVLQNPHISNVPQPPRSPAASSCVGLIRTPSHSGHALREPIPEVHARNQRILTGSIQDVYHNIQWPRYKVATHVVLINDRTLLSAVDSRNHAENERRLGGLQAPGMRPQPQCGSSAPVPLQGLLRQARPSCADGSTMSWVIPVTRPTIVASAG